MKLVDRITDCFAYFLSLKSQVLMMKSHHGNSRAIPELPHNACSDFRSSGAIGSTDNKLGYGDNMLVLYPQC